MPGSMWVFVANKGRWRRADSVVFEKGRMVRVIRMERTGGEHPRRRLLVSATITAIGWLASSSAVAQSGATGALILETQQGEGRGIASRSGVPAGRPTVTAVRAAQAPNIDGRLDDAMWRTAALIDTFVQEQPVEGAPATEKTEVRVAFDSEKLYFGIHASYGDRSLIRANRSDRDKTDDDDTVTVFLEPFLDYLRGYSFSVNGSVSSATPSSW